jgi:catechol 2,3-dioxygenase-like lactoylglutathione lyase family enzyme
MVQNLAIGVNWETCICAMLLLCSYIKENSIMNNSFLATADKLKQLSRPLLVKTLFLLASMAWSQIARSQTSDSIAFKADGAFFALFVADAGASSKWYCEKLGMKVIKYLPRQDKVTVAILQGGGLIVELIQNDDALPLTKVVPAIQSSILVHGFFKAGVIVEDFDKLISLFRQRGVEIAYGPYPSKGDERANVIIKDNAGNLIQFFARE